MRKVKNVFLQLTHLYIPILIAAPAWAIDKIGRADVIDLNDHKGSSYLHFMQTQVKPKLDSIATNGYQVVNSKDAISALDSVSEKVKKRALRAAGSAEALKNIAEKLQGKTVTLYTLPGEIARIDRSASRYDLSTYFGLVSCGGAVLKLDANNFAYNVHYGTGQNPKDNQTGRSFGAGPSRDAEDASDKAYLEDLESYVKSPDDISKFYRTIITALTDTDVTGISKISDEGQTLLTDFLAVYTAEQDRNLMDGRISSHWDAALLEVTLLSSFHAGQSKITLFFDDPNQGRQVFTDTVVNQEPGGTPRTRKRKANLTDYWQFSSNPDPASRNRSGINITRDEFRALGKYITQYERTNNPAIIKRVEKALGLTAPSKNLFESLSGQLINPSAPRTFGANGGEVVESMVEFLSQVRTDSEKITLYIKDEVH